MSLSRSVVVSLIGRPNVGKSTLFNRLIGKSTKAITLNTPGVTRDRNYGLTSLDEINGENKTDIIVVDTGGFYPEKIEDLGRTKKEQTRNAFFNEMRDHAKIAVNESDLVLFIVDVREGLIPYDRDICEFLRASKKPFYVVINKFDSPKQDGEEYEFFQLGIDPDQTYRISSTHGLGVDDLKRNIQQFALQAIKEKITLEKGVIPEEEVVSSVAIVGAPNAGKSTLLNLLSGSNRALVSDIAGTTMDPIEGYFDLYFGKDVEKLNESNNQFKNNQTIGVQYERFQKMHEAQLIPYHGEDEDEDAELEYLDKQVFQDSEVTVDEIESEGNYWRSIKIVDTAGIRKKSQVKGTLETESVYRSLKSITDSQVVIFMVDGLKGVTHQDRRLMDIALEKGKSVVIAVNKIDLLKDKLKTAKQRKEWLLDLRYVIPWLSYVDIVPISAKNNRGIKQLKQAIKKTILIRYQKVSTAKLNKKVFDMVEKHPIMIKGRSTKAFRIKYASMLKANPPTFLMFANRSKNIPDHYKRYLKNGLRTEFGLKNSPVHLIFRSGKDMESKTIKAKKV